MPLTLHKEMFKLRSRISWLRRWLAVAAILAVLSVSVSSSALANLAGSNFDASDGNLVLDDESQDWVNAPGLSVGIDKPTGTNDNSLGQGTKEDSPVPTVVSGSIPNNKSDLTRFYVANEKVGGKEYLYLAWERVQEPSGTTNMDFEFNQSKTLSSNGVTPVRTAGDILIKYDLSRGGSSPTLGYHIWLTSGSAAQCEANNSLPCWGKGQSLAGHFEGAINGGAVNDPLAGTSLSARTFGEAAINLTDAGLLPQGTCEAFSGAYLKSRASDSFTAEIKDFIAPIPVNINNCGTINILKTDDDTPAKVLEGAEFTLYTDNAPLGGSLGAEDIATDTTCTTGADGTCSMQKVLFGQYWVVETVGVPGHDLAPPQQAILTAAQTTISLTFINPRQPATVNILKVDDAGTVMAGAVFTLHTDNGGQVGSPVAGKSCTTGADGTCSITNILPPGTYWVVETVTPAGYATAAPQQVTLALNQTVELTFVNPRLFTIIVLVCDQSTGKLYSSNVTLGGGEPKASLGAPPAGLTDAQLCGLGGARYVDNQTGDYSVSVNIPTVEVGKTP